MSETPPTPVPRRFKRWQVSAVLGILLVAALWFATRDPVYQFRLTQIREPSQIERLSRLAHEVQRIKAWQPVELDAERIANLADWIRFPTNAHAESVRDLERSSSEPKFAAVNGTLSLLPHISAAELKRWRSCKQDDVVLDLTRMLTASIAQRRVGSIRQAVREMGPSTELAQLGLPPFPDSTHWVRRSVRGVIGSPVRDGQIWCDTFLAAFERDIAPIAKFHELIAEFRSLNLGSEPRSSLMLRVGTGQSGSGELTRLRGEQSTSTWELWFVQREASGAIKETSTGILFHDVPWAGLKRNGTGRLNVPVRADVHPIWPPPADADHVALQRLEPFLDRLGFPRGLDLSSDENVCEIVYAGDWKSPKINLRVKGVTWAGDLERDATPWRGEVRVTLTPQGNYETLQQEMASQTSAFQTDLAKHVRRWDRLAGFPVTIDLDERAAGRVVARVQPPEAPGFTLRGAIDQTCTLKFEALPNELRERRAWVELLTSADQRLANWQDRLRLRSFDIDRDTQTVAVIADLPNPQVPGKMLRVAASRPVKGKLTVTVPDIPTVAAAPANPLSVDNLIDTALNAVGDPDFTVEQLDAAARQIIREIHPGLAPHVEVVGGSRGRVKTLRCGLRLGDWPTLELGPVTVSGPDDVRRQVEHLLSRDSVHKASLAQWRPDRSDTEGPSASQSAWNHLRLNDVAGVIAEWDPSEPRAVIGCNVNLGLQPLNWSEKLQLLGGNWSEELVTDLQNKIQPQLALRFGPNDERLPESLRGVILGVSADTGRFGPGRWLRTRPLTVALKGVVLIPWFGLQTEASMLLDQDGFHAENVSVSVPGTIPLPNMAISDPRITIDFDKQGLELDAKFTPPVILPSGDPGGLVPAQFADVSASLDDARLRVDNPWLHAACLRMTLHGRLKDPQVRAGATLQALQFAMAHGQLRYHVESRDFRGELAALRDVPYMDTIPLQLGGQVHYSGRDQFLSLGGGAGRDSNAWAQLSTMFRWDDRTPTDQRAQFDGHVRVPYLGSMIKAGGNSDPQLQNYLMHAEGIAGPWFAKLEADPKDVRWTWGLKDFPDLKYEMSAPGLHLFPEDEVRQKLVEVEARSKDARQAPRAAAVEEQQFVERRFAKRPASTTTGPDRTTTPATVDPSAVAPANIISTRPSPVALDANHGENSIQLFTSDIRIRLVKDQIEFFLPNNGNPQILFTYPLASVALQTPWNQVDYWYGQRKSPQGGAHEVVIHDPAGAAVWHVSVHWAAGGGATLVRDLSSELRTMGLGLPSALTAEQKQKAGRAELELKHFQQAMIWEWFMLRGRLNVTDVRLQSADDGYDLEYKLDEQGTKSDRAYFVQWRRQALQYVILDPRHIDANQRQTVHGLLKERDLPHRDFTVSAVSNDMMVGWGRQDAGWAVSFVTRENARVMPLTLSGLTSPNAFRHHVWGEAALRSDGPTGGEHTFFGPQGAAVQDGDSLWLCRLDDAAPSWAKIMREQFVQKSDGVSQRLPATWRTREKRRLLPWRDVAVAALADWRDLRRENSEWGVNPLIMLTGLAKGVAP